jgi:DNA mismatch endonuclease (patch repair protein)
VDRLSPERRSWNMRRIRGQDTGPERAVRRFLHGIGLRYRLCTRDLPGKPDLVFASRMACVFVHGCFWHGCTKCIDGTRRVRTNSEFWSSKITGNKARDRRNERRLRRLGWHVFTLWECETTDLRKLRRLALRLQRLPNDPPLAGRKPRQELLNGRR